MFFHAPSDLGSAKRAVFSKTALHPFRPCWENHSIWLVLGFGFEFPAVFCERLIMDVSFILLYLLWSFHCNCCFGVFFLNDDVIYCCHASFRVTFGACVCNVVRNLHVKGFFFSFLFSFSGTECHHSLHLHSITWFSVHFFIPGCSAPSFPLLLRVTGVIWFSGFTPRGLAVLQGSISSYAVKGFIHGSDVTSQGTKNHLTFHKFRLTGDISPLSAPSLMGIILRNLAYASANVISA